jgi:hypothetical protein
MVLSTSNGFIGMCLLGKLMTICILPFLLKEERAEEVVITSKVTKIF